MDRHATPAERQREAAGPDAELERAAAPGLFGQKLTAGSTTAGSNRSGHLVSYSVATVPTNAFVRHGPMVPGSGRSGTVPMVSAGAIPR